MNLTCMDVYKSFWSVQCKKFQLDFLSFFAGNFAGMTIQGVVSDNHARLSELMMMMITAWSRKLLPFYQVYQINT